MHTDARHDAPTRVRAAPGVRGRGRVPRRGLGVPVAVLRVPRVLRVAVPAAVARARFKHPRAARNVHPDLRRQARHHGRDRAVDARDCVRLPRDHARGREPVPVLWPERAHDDRGRSARHVGQVVVRGGVYV